MLFVCNVLRFKVSVILSVFCLCRSHVASVCACVRALERAFMRACVVRVCVRACVRACVRMYVRACLCAYVDAEETPRSFQCFQNMWRQNEVALHGKAEYRGYYTVL